MLLAIVAAALQRCRRKRCFARRSIQQKRILGLMEQACFRFRTLEEAGNLAFLIANCFPEPETRGLRAARNAHQRGGARQSGHHLRRKTRLVLAGRLCEEIGRRLALPKTWRSGLIFGSRQPETSCASASRTRARASTGAAIMEISPERATHPHGRGIATRGSMSFTSVDYSGCGNEVLCTVALNGHGAKNRPRLEPLLNRPVRGIRDSANS